MEKIRVIIAEKDPRQKAELAEELSRCPGVAVAGSTESGLEAIRLLAEHKPDVLITNIILPQYDAFAILDQLQAQERSNRPRVIVLSSLTMEATIQKAFAKGTDEYMIKPVDVGLLARKIYELMNRRDLMEQQCTPQAEPRPAAHDSDDNRHDRTRQTISTLFLRIGLPAHLLGFRFAQEAVFMLVEDPMLMKNRTKVLYPIIAEKHHTSAFCVERAIRHVIAQTWERGIAAKYEREYGQSSRLHLPADRPTSGEFIALLAEYIRPRYRSESLRHEA